MAINTTDIVAPVLATAEVVVLFTAGVASKTRLRSLLGRLVLEGDLTRGTQSAYRTDADGR